jgi:hypothetical protein
VSGQIYVPTVLSLGEWLPVLMPVRALCRMLGSLSLVEIDHNIPGRGSIAWPQLWPTEALLYVCVSGRQSAATHFIIGDDTRETLFLIISKC